MSEADPRMLTLAQIDGELRFRSEEFERITATLLELDRHPGLTLIRRFPPTGVTERAWVPVREALESMWQDHTRLRTILEAARTVRGVRARVDDAARVELTRLLREGIEVSRTPIPMALRSLTGPSEQVLTAGPAETVHRMRSGFPRVAEFLDAVDAVNTRIMSGLVPIQDRVDAAGALAGELAEVQAGIADLLRRSATDPLALTPEEIDARVAGLDAMLKSRAGALARAAAIRADWPAALARARAGWETVRASAEHHDRVRAEVEAKISTGPLPPREILDAGLVARVDALAAGAVGELMAAQAAIDEASARVAAATELLQGLLDRRAELRGRLAAYRAKAARLGVVEDHEVLAAARLAEELAARRPCDLAAVTRAVADYQRVVGEKSGRKP
ncbi:hypothetical protein [Nocardia bovistercoris]|uniref:Uncharacterized protein n=1 Tax=Nocardia bovistercoris TaxID=2785916 RepID=A0A931IFL8_9NOCA|nr:hypothetical protein [Nocardia bovistercoris]MBH0780416.1 hypothetical protein [Nocardia bovistercoris]